MDGSVISNAKLQPINKFHDMNSIKNYEVIQKLGQGTFGVVQKARNIKTKQLVALKQLINHSAKEGFPITAMREITILKQLNHENILKIIDMIYEEPKVSNPQDLIRQRGCFYTVCPYMSSDLVGLLENPNVKLELAHIKCLMIQLLKGIQYVHEQNFLHRDIKAANILIDFNGVLKIADFGLARIYHGNVPRLGLGPGGGERTYTGLVVTRWYRPPELLLGERKYTTAVDIWGIGCVFGELFTHKPILVGQTDSHQAQLIFSLLGPPNSWMNASQLPNKQDFNIGLTCKRTLESRFKLFMPQAAIDLLSKLLTLDPYKRFNALDALNHEFFKNEPYPLKPHELPKFEESHEIDKERFKKIKEKSSHSNNFPKGPSHNLSKMTNTKPISYFNKPKESGHDVYIPNKVDSYVPLTKSESSYQNIRDEASNNGELRRSDSYSRSGGLNRVDSITSYQGLRDRSPKRSANKSVTTTDLPKKPFAGQGKKTETPLPKKPIDASKTQTPKNLQLTALSASNAPDLPNRPISPSKTSGIFMMSSRQKRLKPSSSITTKKVPIKKKKLSDDVNDSDLTDLDEDVHDNDKFNSFLDWETYSKSPDYRRYLFEKKQFESKK